MLPRLYDKYATKHDIDTTNGYGILTTCTSCEVTEARNGEFSVSLKVVYDDLSPEVKHAIKKDNLIVALVPDGSQQIFRIQEVTEHLNEPTDIYAVHISYDLANYLLEPCSATNVITACDMLTDNTHNKFTFHTDQTDQRKFTVKEPSTVRGVLAGSEGSLVDTYRGEFKFDNYDVYFNKHRGSTEPVYKISYGYNLTKIEQAQNYADCVTEIRGFVKQTSNEDEHYYYGNTITRGIGGKTKWLDVSSRFDQNATVTTAEIDKAVNDYFDKNKPQLPKVNIKIDFVDIIDLNSLNVQDAQKLQLCDYVEVYYPPFNVSTSAQVVKYQFNCLLESYTSLELGDTKATISDTVKSIVDSSVGKLENTVTTQLSAYSQAQKKLSTLLANGLGLFITEVPNGAGYEMYLHNKPNLSDSNIRYRVNTSGFAVSTDFGKTWNAGITSTGNAVFNALAANEIDALKITGSEIKGSHILGSTADFGGYYVNDDGKFVSGDNNIINSKMNISVGSSYGVIGVSPDQFYALPYDDPNVATWHTDVIGCDSMLSMNINSSNIPLTLENNVMINELSNIISLSTFGNIIRPSGTVDSDINVSTTVDVNHLRRPNLWSSLGFPTPREVSKLPSDQMSDIQGLNWSQNKELTANITIGSKSVEQPVIGNIFPYTNNPYLNVDSGDTGGVINMTTKRRGYDKVDCVLSLNPDGFYGMYQKIKGFKCDKDGTCLQNAYNHGLYINNDGSIKMCRPDSMFQLNNDGGCGLYKFNGVGSDHKIQNCIEIGSKGNMLIYKSNSDSSSSNLVIDESGGMIMGRSDSGVYNSYAEFRNDVATVRGGDAEISFEADRVTIQAEGKRLHAHWTWVDSIGEYVLTGWY